MTPEEIEDYYIGTYHPEFGTFWCGPDGQGYQLMVEARRQGMEEAAQAVLAYPMEHQIVLDRLAAVIRNKAKELK
jgi:hypothetical protein